MNIWEHDKALMQQGFTCLCGVDEAGRGPLAGPVFAAAVILPPDFYIEGLNDSKKLTAKCRDKLYEQIKAHCPHCVATASEQEIDTLNILQATFLAMKRAHEGLLAQGYTPDLTLVDGNRLPPLTGRTQALVGGDGRSAAIAAASILAKVERDRAMCALAAEHPEYAFEKHKGYGTKLHYEILDQHGPCPAHRRSFLKKWAEAKL